MKLKRIGVDLAKQVFQVHGVDSHEQVVCRKQIKRARLLDFFRQLEPCLVVMEASGGYERTAHKALAAQGVAAAIVNPKRVRDFARGMGLEAKTDRVDARLIARYGEVMRPAATPLPDPARAELREILACRRQLVAEIATRRQQLEQLQSPLVRAQVEKTLTFLRQEAKALDQLLRATIKAHPALAADAALLTSMPGCGPILAATLLATSGV